TATHLLGPPALQPAGWLSVCAQGFGFAVLALLLIALLPLQGCATLPDAEEEKRKVSTEPVQFENARGPVSAATSATILKRLDAGGAASDVLQKHLAYEQAFNIDSPLVTGNKLTLLQNG